LSAQGRNTTRTSTSITCVSALRDYQSAVSEQAGHVWYWIKFGRDGAKTAHLRPPATATLCQRGRRSQCVGLRRGTSGSETDGFPRRRAGEAARSSTHSARPRRAGRGAEPRERRDSWISARVGVRIAETIVLVLRSSSLMADHVPEALTRIVRSKLADGTLPHDDARSVEATNGSGETCAACDRTIAFARVELEARYRNWPTLPFQSTATAYGRRSGSGRDQLTSCLVLSCRQQADFRFVGSSPRAGAPVSGTMWSAEVAGSVLPSSVQYSHNDKVSPLPFTQEE
jgi:hypothetical protein